MECFADALARTGWQRDAASRLSDLCNVVPSKTPDETHRAFCLLEVLCIRLLRDSSRAVISPGPVGAFHRFNSNECTFLWRVDKLILANINTNVRCCTASRIKEYEIARMQIRLRDRHALTTNLR